MNVGFLIEEAKRKAPEIAERAEKTEELVRQLTKENWTTSYLLHPPLLAMVFDRNETRSI